MRKIIIAFIAFFTSCVYVYSDNTAEIWGHVHNRFTGEDLGSATVSLLRNDSLVEKMTLNQAGITYGNRYVWIFNIDLNAKGDYSLLFENEGYSTYKLALDFSKKLKKDEQRYVEDVALDRLPKEQKLNGVTVTATKVKFYHRGDTVVYNADAFQTAEGSMLDALIKQMPGVELSDNGEIKVNGRKVESLLLNGEKFFNGNNEVMLQNLPAYMVKNVKTYEKAGLASTLMGRNMGDKEFVMDVNLKKEYSIGWIGNAEVGYGSAERYLARLFAMRFTNNSRIALYGNCNNLNDVRKPGENTSWTPETMPSGLLATKKVGADLLFKEKRDLIKYEGNFELSSSRLDNKSRVTQEQYFPQNSVLSRILSQRNDADIKFTSYNTFELWKKTGKEFLNCILPSITKRQMNSRIIIVWI